MRLVVARRPLPPAGSRLIRTARGPAVITNALLGAEEIHFTAAHERDATTREDLETTLALAERCRGRRW